ncbi:MULTISPECIES: hypothetical protein [Thalassotalea]|uniref:hypothetical protein n=1 Tax=Thalassotalea TaxID=1518149 RepID=UPI000943A033|nr:MULTISPECIES: hypothetical protein [Thalassotalea]OKY28064.1 hypothetical protein BI291_06410 [Thalassotalea sp. PP2-459]
MSLFKSLLLAIIATLFLTYVLGTSFVEYFDVDVYMGEELIEPLKAISISALVVVILTLVAVAIVVSVFGTVIFLAMLVFGAVAMALLGAFWPIFMIAGVIWLCTRNKQRQYN